MQADLVLFGAGGFGREVHQLVKDINRRQPSWNLLGFLDEKLEAGQTVQGLPVLGSYEWLADHPRARVTVAIGQPAIKHRIVQRLRTLGAGFGTLIHPDTTLGDGVALGDGTIVAAGCRLTTDIQIGAHVILNLNCTVGHDSTIGDYTTLAPNCNLSGNTHLGEGCDLGTNAVTLPGVSLGAWSVLGAAALLRESAPDNVVMVGVPARQLRGHLT